MPTSYTSLLGLALPVTGELSGTWGDTVNDYITQYLDSAVEGTQTISGSQTSVTLSVTNGTSLSQVGSGSTGSAQYAIINCTGNPASTLTITAPASSRQYLVLNSTSTSQSVIFRGAGPTTGVTLVSGERCIVAWNGSDFVKIATSTADGVTTFSAGTTGFTPSTATSGAVTLGGTLATTNGGTGLTSFTANGVVYASSTSALTTGSALTFDGTILGNALTANATYSELLRLRNNGVGDGTGAKLSFNFSGTERGYVGATFSSGWITDLNGTDATRFLLGGSEQMRLTSTGLGIGTSSPAYKLDISGSNPRMRIQPSTGTEFALYQAQNTGGSAFFGLENSAGSALSTGAAYSLNIYHGGAYPILFSTNAVERMRLDSSGNLGIGTSSPAYRVDASGQVRALESGTGSGDGGFIASTSGANGNAGVLFQTNSASRWNLTTSGTNGANLRIYNYALASTVATFDSSGNLGLGVTPSVWSQGKAFEISAVGEGLWGNGLGDIWMMNGAYFNAGWKYSGTTRATAYRQGAGTTDGSHSWHIAASGTAGNAISFTQAMTLDASGNWKLGTTSFGTRAAISGTNTAVGTTVSGSNTGLLFLYDTSAAANAGPEILMGSSYDGTNSIVGTSIKSYKVPGSGSGADQYDHGLIFKTSNFSSGLAERARITPEGFTRPVAYADTVVALGNTGTATTINLQTANVFTATLTGNCTFTLSNPIATGSSSFTLILTNDGTAGRTVAWAGGSFVFPGGAAALSRTTTANAVDVWVFFTPNGGTTWYGNIAMKDMKA